MGWYNAPMNRRLLSLGLILAAFAGAARPVFAEIPDDKAERIKTYQSQHLELSYPSSGSYEVRMGVGTASVRVGDPELVRRASESEFVEKLADASWDRGWKQLVAGLLLPLGLYMAIDNFFGVPRPTAAPSFLPPPHLSYWPARDWRSFTLLVVGSVGAAVGAGQWGSFVAEHVGLSYPNLLGGEDAARAVKVANLALMDELALDPADLQPPKATASTPTAAAPIPTPAVRQGEAGTALGELAKAQAALKSQRGEGYRLYLVYTKELSDQTGKLQKGSWHYLFFHPQRNESLDVTVPVLAGNPSIGPASEAFKEWIQATGLVEAWKLDSTRAMALFSPELLKRGKPWLAEEATLLLYPNYGSFLGPLWVLDLGQGPADVGVGVDAASGSVVDLRSTGRSPLPSGGAQPSR